MVKGSLCLSDPLFFGGTPFRFLIANALAGGSSFQIIGCSDGLCPFTTDSKATPAGDEVAVVP